MYMLESKKGAVGWAGGDIFADVLFLSFFPMKTERSAKDSGSTFASKSCALTRKQSYIRLLPNLITKSAPSFRCS